ncbi:Hypothetical protein, putative [Bodo saltans]|uniref:Uncharacterized protein n=1 Tax=Bodo saltans TaxID=75058 RepID=A0A0S4IZM3_BODSA|nr:Hypothetical protein, putative [Bodo saltans]|eukprot:CUG68484.1 Hypothetical protein, putative [Bodo saltans]
MSAQPTTSAVAAPPQPRQQQYYCASCHTPQDLPRPSPTGTLFQCQNCRMSATGELKVFYCKRVFAVEHTTR